jgi:hypothetical protein
MEERLARARADCLGAGSPGFAELASARAALEAADLLLGAADSLRHSDGSASAAALLREALRQTLLARIARAGDKTRRDGSDEALWEAFHALPASGRTGGAAPSALESAREAFLRPPAESEEAQDRARSDAQALRRAVLHGLAPLQEEATALARVAAARWLRWALLGLLLIGIGVGGWQLVRWQTALPNLSLGRPTQASSLHGGYTSAQGLVDGVTEAIGARTSVETGPWLQVDLGESRGLAGVRVYNRSDCCQGLALPLVLELSEDGEHFVEVARRTTWFWRWGVRLRSARARFVRVRVAAKTHLHLNELEVYGSRP